MLENVCVLTAVHNQVNVCVCVQSKPEDMEFKTSHVGLGICSVVPTVTREG